MTRRLLLLLCSLLVATAAWSADAYEYRVRHILVDTEDQAQMALSRIQAGESFESVAREVSRDPGTAKRGGLIDGWVRAGSFVEPFGDEVRRLAVGEMSAHAVRTAFGWHVVRVDDRRPAGSGHPGAGDDE